MIEFKELRLGMEVYFIDFCLDIVHTKVSGLQNNGFQLKLCAQHRNNAQDCNYLFKTRKEAVKNKVQEYDTEIKKLQNKIKRIRENQTKVIDYRNK
jgi:hypothetical protein